MARTTVTEVREIITTDLTDAQVTTWINIANTIVTANVTCGLSDAVLEEIERQLTAHFISLLPTSEGSGVGLPIKSEKLGDASVSYDVSMFTQGGTMGSTVYGKTALMLDTCGGLAAMGKRKISIKAITSFE